MKHANYLKISFALIYIKKDGTKIASGRCPSASEAKYKGQVAVRNSHRSNVERFEIYMVKDDNRENTQRIMRSRGVSNWWQF